MVQGRAEVRALLARFGPSSPDRHTPWWYADGLGHPGQAVCPGEVQESLRATRKSRRTQVRYPWMKKGVLVRATMNIGTHLRVGDEVKIVSRDGDFATVEIRSGLTQSAVPVDYLRRVR